MTHNYVIWRFIPCHARLPLQRIPGLVHTKSAPAS
ncbi:hypothetical protein ACTODO_00021 [Schaalia dentiphila ATCC 17982]|uniref:Uncharacterized protein n=1 Tax=Schaalia dentiphila ATCC 17982 TaxID=411466 RepID=A7B8S2_9ACTO|nr:hypothetical protein ACTODO_00021 [Schaalia odontolytica ATCC 17982]